MGQTGAFTTAGTTISVTATAPATFDAAGYGALSFTEIKEVTDFGDIGRVYALITHNPVGQRETFKFKGSYNDGALALTMGKFPTDPGQLILDTAVGSDDDFYFKIEFQDNVGGTSNSIIYFPGKVMSNPDSIGGADSITGKSSQIEINGSIITVAAVA